MTKRRLANRPRHKGFTLLELLVVIAIIAILIGLLVMAVQRVRESAKSAECANQLKQLALASHSCQATHGRLPPAAGWFPSKNIEGGAGIGPLFFHLLPFLEQGNLYQSARVQDAARRQDYYDYERVGMKTVALFNCPSDPTLPLQGGAPGAAPYAASSYAGNFLVFGAVDKQFRCLSGRGQASLVKSFPDGTANTLLFAEKYAVIGQPGGTGWEGGCHWGYWGRAEHTPFFALWKRGNDANAIGPTGADDGRDSRFQVRPTPVNANPFRCATGHSAMNAAMADASVRKLAAGMEALVWWANVTPAAGDQAE